MDINKLVGNNPRAEGPSTAVKPRTATNVDTPSMPKASEAINESVTLTETARTMNAARDTATTAPFDEAKVARIKADVDEGGYAIDYHRLADRLIDSKHLPA